ncbi:MAG: hypothetical protein TH68_08375, partial [Candidatus Synechococcus spongiarum 142]
TGYMVGGPSSATVMVADDETPGLMFSPATVTVPEADSATYTVRLAKEPTTTVTVTVKGMGNGVSVDTDGGMAGEQTILSFSTTDWKTAQTVTVRAAADDDNASPETVRLSHSADGGGYESVSQELVVTVTDDDTAGLLFYPTAVTIAEAASVTYMVKLATEPTETVTVTVSDMGNGVGVDTDSGMAGEQTILSFTT